MEIELKYYLGDNLAKDRILDDRHLAEMRNPEGDETLKMHAIYFDTAEGDLRNKKIALRARWENEHIMVTLKWKGSAVDGLHVRGELNVPADEAYLMFTIASAPSCSASSTIRLVASALASFIICVYAPSSPPTSVLKLCVISRPTFLV